MPSWNAVRSLAYYTLSRHPSLLRSPADRARLERLVVGQADSLVAAAGGAKDSTVYAEPDAATGHRAEDAEDAEEVQA